MRDCGLPDVSRYRPRDCRLRQTDGRAGSRWASADLVEIEAGEVD
jgi:hypothetical protein